MKIVPWLRALRAATIASCFLTQLPAAESPRERLSLDANWKFHLGDDWPDALRLDKAGVSSGPAAGLTPGTFALQTKPCGPRPAVP